jgi:hypothetical protein
MSRSRRKPYCVDGYKGSKNKQYGKKQSNRTIRRSKDVPNGKAYKKFYERWSFCDWSYYVPPENLEKYWPEWWKLLRK